MVSLYANQPPKIHHEIRNKTHSKLYLATNETNWESPRLEETLRDSTKVVIEATSKPNFNEIKRWRWRKSNDERQGTMEGERQYNDGANQHTRGRRKVTMQ